MKTNKRYSEVERLTGLQIANLHGLDSAGTSNVEVMPFSKGEFIKLKEFSSLPINFKDVIVGVHCVRRLIYSETAYVAGDRFKISGYNFVLTKTVDYKFFMINLDSGTAMSVAGGTEANNVYEAELREMFRGCGNFVHVGGLIVV